MDSVLDQTVRGYLDEAAGGAPTPGGGSVAALAGALGAAMASMVGAFTLKSKKCAEHHEEMESTRNTFEDLRAKLAEQADADVQAFAAMDAAYGMPKETDAEKTARRDAIRKASIGAMGPPLATARLLRTLAGRLPRLAEIGNRNLVTDTGVAALLCEAAFRAAVLNVHINIKSLEDTEKAGAIATELAEAGEELRAHCNAAVVAVEKALQ